MEMSPLREMQFQNVHNSTDVGSGGTSEGEPYTYMLSDSKVHFGSPVGLLDLH